MLQHGELREVLERAEEIQLQSAISPESSELDGIVAAAEEAGLSRDAVLQAVRERLSLLGHPPEIGDRVFAKSADGHFYVAKVVSVHEGRVKVLYLNGSEHALGAADLRPCTFLPGQKLMCPWPHWGWWTCTVLSFDNKRDKVKVTDGWGTEKSFKVSEVRLPIERSLSERTQRMKVALTLWAAAIAGGAVGSAITWWLTR